MRQVVTRPPLASVSSNTRKPDAGLPSGSTSAGARSTNSIANRTSGLSEPKRSIASSNVKRGNGIWAIGRSGVVAFDTAIAIDSTKSITAARSTCISACST